MNINIEKNRKRLLKTAEGKSKYNNQVVSAIKKLDDLLGNNWVAKNESDSNNLWCFLEYLQLEGVESANTSVSFSPESSTTTHKTFIAKAYNSNKLVFNERIRFNLESYDESEKNGNKGMSSFDYLVKSLGSAFGLSSYDIEYLNKHVEKDSDEEENLNSDSDDTNNEELNRFISNIFDGMLRESEHPKEDSEKYHGLFYQASQKVNKDTIKEEVEKAKKVMKDLDLSGMLNNITSSAKDKYSDVKHTYKETKEAEDFVKSLTEDEKEALREYLKNK